MTVAGLDIGGTKIEVQVFDEDWNEVARNRCATPKTYKDLVSDIASQVEWAAKEVDGLDATGVTTSNSPSCTVYEVCFVMTGSGLY